MQLSPKGCEDKTLVGIATTTGPPRLASQQARHATITGTTAPTIANIFKTYAVWRV